jgi:hypothetical protein
MIDFVKPGEHVAGVNQHVQVYTTDEANERFIQSLGTTGRAVEDVHFEQPSGDRNVYIKVTSSDITTGKETVTTYTLTPDNHTALVYQTLTRVLNIQNKATVSRLFQQEPPYKEKEHDTDPDEEPLPFDFVTWEMSINDQMHIGDFATFRGAKRQMTVLVIDQEDHPDYMARGIVIATTESNDLANHFDTRIKALEDVNFIGFFDVWEKTPGSAKTEMPQYEADTPSGIAHINDTAIVGMDTPAHIECPAEYVNHSNKYIIKNIVGTNRKIEWEFMYSVSSDMDLLAHKVRKPDGKGYENNVPQFNDDGDLTKGLPICANNDDLPEEDDELLLSKNARLYRDNTAVSGFPVNYTEMNLVYEMCKMYSRIELSIGAADITLDTASVEKLQDLARNRVIQIHFSNNQSALTLGAALTIDGGTVIFDASGLSDPSALRKLVTHEMCVRNGGRVLFKNLKIENFDTNARDIHAVHGGWVLFGKGTEVNSFVGVAAKASGFVYLEEGSVLNNGLVNNEGTSTCSGGYVFCGRKGDKPYNVAKVPERVFGCHPVQTTVFDGNDPRTLATIVNMKAARDDGALVFYIPGSLAGGQAQLSYDDFKYIFEGRTLVLNTVNQGSFTFTLTDVPASGAVLDNITLIAENADDDSDENTLVIDMVNAVSMELRNCRIKHPHTTVKIKLKEGAKDSKITLKDTNSEGLGLSLKSGAGYVFDGGSVNVKQLTFELDPLTALTHENDVIATMTSGSMINAETVYKATSTTLDIDNTLGIVAVTEGLTNLHIRNSKNLVGVMVPEPDPSAPPEYVGSWNPVAIIKALNEGTTRFHITLSVPITSDNLDPALFKRGPKTLFTGTEWFFNSSQPGSAHEIKITVPEDSADPDPTVVLEGCRITADGKFTLDAQGKTLHCWRSVINAGGLNLLTEDKADVKESVLTIADTLGFNIYEDEDEKVVIDGSAVSAKTLAFYPYEDGTDAHNHIVIKDGALSVKGIETQALGAGSSAANKVWVNNADGVVLAAEVKKETVTVREKDNLVGKANPVIFPTPDPEQDPKSKHYTFVVHTQEDFLKWVNNEDSGQNDYSSVLIRGNKYTISDADPTLDPAWGIMLDSLSTTLIDCEEQAEIVVSKKTCVWGIGYSAVIGRGSNPPDPAVIAKRDKCKINNLTVRLDRDEYESTPSAIQIRVFDGVSNLYRCAAHSVLSSYDLIGNLALTGFENCSNARECTADIVAVTSSSDDPTGLTLNVRGFVTCTNLCDCASRTNGTKGNSRGYWGCRDMRYCTASPSTFTLAQIDPDDPSGPKIYTPAQSGYYIGISTCKRVTGCKVFMPVKLEPAPDPNDPDVNVWKVHWPVGVEVKNIRVSYGITDCWCLDNCVASISTEDELVGWGYASCYGMIGCAPGDVAPPEGVYCTRENEECTADTAKARLPDDSGYAYPPANTPNGGWNLETKLL